MKKMKKILAVFLMLLLLCAVGIGIYSADYYHADWEAIGPYPSVPGVLVEEVDKGLVFLPEEAKTGLIFYPGGKVEYKAYIPLMEALAERDILCVLLEMPLNLAVLDINAAEGIPEQFPQVESWYMAGHSLGGSMAASYLSKNSEAFQGLVLLASYSTADLSALDLEVLSVYGSEDGVLNRENYEAKRNNLPEGYEELVLEGANHAGFGMYGEQKGDGTAAIAKEEQIRISAEAIAAFAAQEN